MLLAIDPGTEESAIVTLIDDRVFGEILSNGALLERLRECNTGGTTLAIEMFASQGMAVGRTTFETVKWIGRFQEAFESRGGRVEMIFRTAVKLHLCGVTRARDSNVRQAIIDLYGGTRAKAIGVKASQGPLYGFKSHMWAALAVALTFQAAEKTRRDRYTLKLSDLPSYLNHQ